MKKSFKLILVVLIFVIGLSTISYADVSVSTASISMKTNESKSVTVTGNGVTGTLSVKSSNPNIAIASASTNWIENSSATINITGKSAGNATITISGTVADSTGIDSNYQKTISVTVANNQTSSGSGNSSSGNSNSGNTNQKPPQQTPTKSNVATLSNLGIRPNDFSGFKANTLTYSTEVPYETEKIEIYASKGQEGQKITGAGAKTLKEGQNTFNITVTAEDGKTTKTYTINITRKQQNEVEKPEAPVEENPEEPVEAFGLTDLKIEGLQLSPEFQTDIYEYKVDLKEDIEKLNIETILTEVSSKVEIIGNENLKSGENIVTIIVKSQNEEKSATYQIVVNKTLQKEENVNSNNIKIDKKIILISSGAIIILIIIIAVIIKLNKNKNNGEYVTYTDFYSKDLEDDNEETQRTEEIDNGEEIEEQEEVKRKKHPKGKRFK